MVWKSYHSSWLVMPSAISDLRIVIGSMVLPLALVTELMQRAGQGMNFLLYWHSLFLGNGHYKKVWWNQARPEGVLKSGRFNLIFLLHTFGAFVIPPPSRNLFTYGKLYYWLQDCRFIFTAENSLLFFFFPLFIFFFFFTAHITLAWLVKFCNILKFLMLHCGKVCIDELGRILALQSFWQGKSFLVWIGP